MRKVALSECRFIDILTHIARHANNARPILRLVAIVDTLCQRIETRRNELLHERIVHHYRPGRIVGSIQPRRKDCARDAAGIPIMPKYPALTMRFSANISWLSG